VDCAIRRLDPPGAKREGLSPAVTDLPPSEYLGGPSRPPSPGEPMCAANPSSGVTPGANFGHARISESTASKLSGTAFELQTLRPSDTAAVWPSE
jgi:hypothetical protein